MKLMKVVLLVCVCLSVLPAQCMCFSRGASTATCMDMKPGHISAQSQHTHTASAVTIHTSRIVYLPHHTLMVSVRSSRAFMGLLLHARSVVEDRVVGGKFTLHPPGTHTLSCLSTADTVTHSDKLMKRNLSFTWRAPAQPSGDLRFYITVVHSYFVYWTRIHSAVVHDGTRTGHEPGLQIGIISASPTSSTLTHTSVHTLSEHSNTTHNFLTHTDKHTGTYDPSNRVTHTQLYAMTHTHNHTHTTKGSVNTLHVHTHTHSRPDIAYTPSHTQKHAATTPVTHTHTSPNTVLMSHSLTTHTPRTHMHSLSTACTSPVVTMVTLITRTYTSHGYTLAPSQHTHSSNILTHTPTVSHTPTGSHTPSHTPTASNTFTHTITESNTPTAPHILTHTPARSNTPTHTPTAPHILTHTPARSNTPKHTPTAPHILTHTPARSNTPKHTPTAPHILTHTPAGSNTPTHTPTAPHILTHTPAGLYTPTHPPTGLYTSTHPPTGVYTPTHPPTVVYTPTHTPTGLYTPTHTPTGLYTPTNTPTGLYTPTNTPTGLNTPTHTPTGSYTPPHSPSESNTPTHTPVPSSALHPEPSAALRRSVSEPVEPRDDPVVFVKLPDPEPHPESGIKTGGGVKAEPGVGFVSQPVMLMVLSLVLLVMLAVYVQRKHCVRRNGVSLSDSRQESAGVRRVQECGELVQLRRIRENSLLLLQAQYDIITAPGN